MPVPTDITAGTLTITNGSTAVTGVGTAWLASDLRQGDVILWIEGGDGFWQPILADVPASNTALTLVEPWQGPTLTNARYRIRYQWDSSRVSAQSRQLIELLDNGNILALSALTGPGVPVFNGPHSMTIRPEADFVNGVAYDVQVGTLADRDAYDGQAAGFAVLVSDVGDGRSAIYSKASNTSGDWTDPAFVTGPVGPLPTIEAGTTTRGPLATEVAPVTGGYELNLTIPTQVARGNYSGATAYLTGDIVQSAGSSWVALQATTGNAPPTLPTTSNAYWQLLARAGNDGAGTVTTVVGSGGVAVDSTDPTTPAVSLANVPTATVKGRVAAGSGAPTDLSGAQVASILPVFTTSAKGVVPQPTSGDATAKRALLADGTWGAAGVSETVIQSYWMPTNLELAEIAPAPLLIGMATGNGVFDGFNNLSYVDQAGATGANFATAGQISPSNATTNTWTNSLNNNTTGWANFNVRLRVGAAVLTTSGVAVRLTMKGVSSGSTLSISGMFVGHRAASGDVYDFDGTQVRVTVGGSNSFTVAAGATVVSDWITYSLDEARDLVLSYYTTSGDMRTLTGGSSTNLDLWSKSGTSEIEVSNVTGYTQSSGSDIALIDRIEVATAYDSMTVSSQTINLAETPDWARIVAIVQQNGAGVNSDVVFSVSRNGTAFANATMSEIFTRGNGSVYLDSGVLDVTGITSGVAGEWRVQTFNAKGPVILAVGVIFGVNS